MNRLRAHLASELAKKVQASGLVVWDDPDGAYCEVASTLVPDGVPFLAYDGSWFSLRQSIEPYLSSPACPSLVVYVHVKPLAQDPLEEVRQAGKSWSLSLRTLLANALKGELTATRIAAITKQAKTLAEVEAVLDSGSAVDARLVSRFGSADLALVAVYVLGGGDTSVLQDDTTRRLLGDAIDTHFGALVDTSNSDRLRDSLFRLIVQNVIRATTGVLPGTWPGAVGGTVTPAQVTRSQQVLSQLRDPRYLDAHRKLGDDLDRDLALRDSLDWSPALAELDPTPGVEDLAFLEALRLLDAQDHAGAEHLAKKRLTLSRWAQLPPDAVGPDHPYRKWRALDRIAGLHTLLATCKPPTSRDVEELLTWYASQGWYVDRAQRLVELARVDLGHLADLDVHVITARKKYETWLDEVVSTTTKALVADGLNCPRLLRQADVFAQYLSGAVDKTAYVLVDALRLELGHALAQRLGLPDDACKAAVAAVPTITSVGMANVLPGADDGITLSLQGDAAVTYLGGVPIRGVADRVSVLRKHAGSVLDIDFSDLVGRSDSQLSSEIDAVDLVLVRSTDIDAAGESGRLGTAWRSVDGVLDDIVSQLLRLSRLGVRRIVVTADHGFIVLPQQLSTGRVLARPSSKGELHRRCWIGSGGVTPDGALRASLGDLGVGGGLDLVVPSGLAVFPSSGSRQFFHGGLAPQELMIPVVDAVLAAGESPSTGKPKVEVSVAGRGITTGVFAATLSIAGDLFTPELGLRVVARRGKDTKPVARLVAGDGFDPGTGTVTVTSQPAVLTFQVTSNLDPSTPVELHVVDARTGLALARPLKVTVVAPVVVDEDWP